MFSDIALALMKSNKAASKEGPSIHELKARLELTIPTREKPHKSSPLQHPRPGSVLLLAPRTWSQGDAALDTPHLVIPLMGFVPLLVYQPPVAWQELCQRLL